MLAALRRGLYFEAVTLTEEDRLRHASYRGNAARAAAEESAPSLESFFSGLEMAAATAPSMPQTLPRVAQLINKTNQFNLTTRRYTEDQVRAMASSPDWWCRWFRLADRFGDHGLIGVILAAEGTRRVARRHVADELSRVGAADGRFMCRLLAVGRAARRSDGRGWRVHPQREERRRQRSLSADGIRGSTRRSSRSTIFSLRDCRFPAASSSVTNR